MTLLDKQNLDGHNKKVEKQKHVAVLFDFFKCMSWDDDHMFPFGLWWLDGSRKPCLHVLIVDFINSSITWTQRACSNISKFSCILTIESHGCTIILQKGILWAGGWRGHPRLTKAEDIHLLQVSNTTPAPLPFFSFTTRLKLKCHLLDNLSKLNR